MWQASSARTRSSAVIDDAPSMTMARIGIDLLPGRRAPEVGVGAQVVDPGQRQPIVDRILVEHRVDLDDLGAQDRPSPRRPARRWPAPRRRPRRSPSVGDQATRLGGLGVLERGRPRRLGTRQRAEVGRIRPDRHLEGGHHVGQPPGHRPLGREIVPVGWFGATARAPGRVTASSRTGRSTTRGCGSIRRRRTRWPGAPSRGDGRRAARPTIRPGCDRDSRGCASDRTGRCRCRPSSRAPACWSCPPPHSRPPPAGPPAPSPLSPAGLAAKPASRGMVTKPAASSRSFTPMGMPASGPIASPPPPHCPPTAAAARARSSSTATKALMAGLSEAIRSSAWSTRLGCGRSHLAEPGGRDRSPTTGGSPCSDRTAHRADRRRAPRQVDHRFDNLTRPRPGCRSCRRARSDHGDVLDHVAHAVRALAGRSGAATRSTSGPRGSRAGRHRGFAPGQVRFRNGARLEMLMPWDVQVNDFLARFLDRSGPGAAPSDLQGRPISDVALDEVRQAGFEPIGIDRSNPEWMEAFIHPKQATGVVVQLAESSEQPKDADSWMTPPPEGFPHERRPSGDGSGRSRRRRPRVGGPCRRRSRPRPCPVRRRCCTGGVVDSGQAADPGLDDSLVGRPTWCSPCVAGRATAGTVGAADGPTGWLAGRPGRVHHLELRVDEPAAVPRRRSGDRSACRPPEQPAASGGRCRPPTTPASGWSSWAPGDRPTERHRDWWSTGRPVAFRRWLATGDRPGRRSEDRGTRWGRRANPNGIDLRRTPRTPVTGAVRTNPTSVTGALASRPFARPSTSSMNVNAG